LHPIAIWSLVVCVDLHQLRYFVAVVEERGFRKASRVLYVAQPAISQALRQLETELEVQLLHRTPVGVELTEAGGEFLVHARNILGQARQAKAAMHERAGRRSGLRLGVVAGILGAGELTAPIFQEYREAYPSVEMEMEELSFCDQTGPLLGGHLDVALVRGPFDHPDLDVIPIALERRGLMVGAGHELAGETEVDVQDVLGEHTLPLGSPDAWSAFWQLNDLRGRPLVHPGAPPATTISSMQLAVANDTMIITVPDAMGRLAPIPLVRYVGLRNAEPSVIAVARRRGDQRPEVRAFIDEAGRTCERNIHLLAGSPELGVEQTSAEAVDGSLGIDVGRSATVRTGILFRFPPADEHREDDRLPY
jgi:DNA-binding transcriptional LysR family regulator